MTANSLHPRPRLARHLERPPHVGVVNLGHTPLPRKPFGIAPAPAQTKTARAQPPYLHGSLACALPTPTADRGARLVLDYQARPGMVASVLPTLALTVLSDAEPTLDAPLSSVTDVAHVALDAER